MAYKQLSELSDQAKSIHVGIYGHYKDGYQPHYEVIGVGWDSETLTEVVLYKKLDTGTYWSRPVSVWLAEAEVDGKKVVRYKFLH